MLLEYICQMAYNISEYGDVKDAVKEFIKLNPSAKSTKEVQDYQVNAFVKNVYKGGDDSHDVSMKDFVEELKKRGIKIKKEK